MKRLTPNQQSFVDRYVDNLAQTNKKNLSKLVKESGYNTSTDESAAAMASKLLNNPKIKRAIQDELSKQSMPANEVLFHIAKVARGDVKDSSLSDRLKALELLAKYHNLTNTTRISTWQDEAIESIKRGEISYNDFMFAFDDENLAQQLFRQAGVPIE